MGFVLEVVYVPEYNTQDISIFLFMFFLVCEMYVQVTKHSTQDVMWDVTNHRGLMSFSDRCQLGEWWGQY